MARHEIEIGEPYEGMIEELKNDEVSTEEFLERITEDNVHNIYQRRNAQQRQQQQRQ